ncbi:MAG: PAS domain S-box protein, partial [Rhodocyclaceae bacterium]|nr:PAS domain S-box protein [Rhodocyclaceae bacterium]
MPEAGQRGLKRSRASAHLAAGILGLGFIFAALAAFWQGARNHAEAQSAFESLAQQNASRIASQIQLLAGGLYGTRGAVLAAGPTSISRRQFQDFAESRSDSYRLPGSHSFGLVRRVAPGDVAQFVRAARHDGQPDFHLQAAGAHPGTRYIVQFAEPVAVARPAPGFDLASQPAWRAAADRAAESGEPVLSAPVAPLPGEPATSDALLLLLPIYTPGMRRTSAPERSAALLGWAVKSVDADEVLQAAGLSRGPIGISVHDAEAPAHALFANTSRPAGSTVDFRKSVALPAYGRTWQVELWAEPEFAAGSDALAPGSVFALGSLATLVLALAAQVIAQSGERKRELELEQARRSAIMENSSDAIMAVTPGGRVSDWNRGAERMFGIAAPQALGRTVLALVVPEHLAAEEEELRAAVTHGENVAPFDSQRRHLDGRLLEVSISASPILDQKGRCIGYATILRDISAARRTERALAELNETLEQRVAERTAALDSARRDLRTILDALPSQVGSWDRDLRNRLANRAYADWFGLECAQMPGMHLAEVLGEDIYRHNRPYLEAALRGEAQYFEGMPSRDPRGSGHRHAMVHIIPEWVDGEVRGVYTLVHDITELAESRARLARAQRDSAALLHTIDAYAMVSVTDPDGRIVEVNDNFCRACGYTRNELLGRDHRFLKSGLHSAMFWRDMWQQLASGASWRAEICNRTRDGRLYWVDGVVSAFYDDAGQVEKYVAIGSDISTKKQLELEAEVARSIAEQSARFLQEITDRLPLGLAYLDRGLHYRFVNAALCEQFGLARERILGQHASGLPAAALWQAGEQALSQAVHGTAQVVECEQTRCGLAHIYELRLVPDIDAAGAVRGLYAVYADISDRKRAELGLQRALRFQ